MAEKSLCPWKTGWKLLVGLGECGESLEQVVRVSRLGSDGKRCCSAKAVPRLVDGRTTTSVSEFVNAVTALAASRLRKWMRCKYPVQSRPYLQSKSHKIMGEPGKPRLCLGELDDQQSERRGPPQTIGQGGPQGHHWPSTALHAGVFGGDWGKLESFQSSQ